MRPTRYAVQGWLVVASVLLALPGCAPALSSYAVPRHHRSATRPEDLRAGVPVDGGPARALARLRHLPVQPRPRGTEGYRRAAFGPAWADTDHDGCDQRDDVLLRDAVAGTTVVRRHGACDHDVLAGAWHDPYTGRTLRFTDLADLRQAEAIQIDHVVPLAEAWVSGARRWSRGERLRFADDIGELLAVDGPTNRAKGDADPAAWRPRHAYWCRYAERWVAVKAHYSLAVDPPERAALVAMLGACRRRL